MKKTKYIITLLFLGSILLVLIPSCHKYPDDPFLSLKKPYKRLEGNWHISSYEINGVDHHHDFDTLISPHALTDLTFHFYDGYGNFYYDVQGLPFAMVLNFSPPIKPFGTISVVSFGNNSQDTTTKIFLTRLWQMSYNGTRWNSPLWSIRELYKKDWHISYNGIDIKFKK